MRKMRKLSAALALMLTVAVAVPAAGPDGAEAAKTPKLSKTKLNMTVGSTQTIKVKNYSKKVTWKSSKPAVVKVAGKKTSAKLTAKKKGSANVTATYKKGSKKKVLKCKVTVKNKAQTPAPVVTVPTAAPVPTAVVATPDPNATASPTPTFDYDGYKDLDWKQPEGAKINDLFSNYFISGVSTDYGRLSNGESASLVRYHFGSVTMGNENKMETTVSVDSTDEYPEGYSKANVDNYYATNGEGKVILNYETLENVLSYCKAHNLKLRYHAFVWHAQVRAYFFLQDYNWSDYDLEDYEAKGWDTSNYHKLADAETMKKRLNDYISQVIEYIYSHGYGDVVYAYDVINEATNGQVKNYRYYVNENATSLDEVLSTSGSGISFQTNGGVQTGAGGKNVTTNSSPEEVEQMVGYEGRGVKRDNSYWYSTMGTDYLYLSFLYAYNAIQENFEKYKDQYGYKNIPSLIYNDYNQRESDHLALAKFINTACNIANKTDGIKYCNGIGLQSHSVSESAQDRMIKAIADEGFEVQITELDEGVTGDAQATKLKNLYNIYKKYSKNGEYGKGQGDNYIGVTSVTQWGVCDGDGSWGASYVFERDPLPDPEYDANGDKIEVPEPLFRIHPKPAYFGILQAGEVECGSKTY